MQSHSYADASSRMSRLRNDAYELVIRQGPERARVAGTKEKDRKPVDPPPIIQLKITDSSDPQQNYLQSPYYFMCTNLYPAASTEIEKDTTTNSTSYNQALAGTLVSSLHRLKDVDNTDGGFFVFGDLSVKVEGQYRLRFSLFEISGGEVHYIKSITSGPFTVYPSKNFPGMSESTFLSRSFGDQGVRLRIRKEPRTLIRKRAFRPPPDAYPSAPMVRMPGSPDHHYAHHGGYPTPHSSVDYGHGPYHDPHKRMKMDQCGSQYHGRETYNERPPYGEPPNYVTGYPSYPANYPQRSPTTPGGYFPPQGPPAHGYNHYPPHYGSREHHQPHPQHPHHDYERRHSSHSGPSPSHPSQQPSPIYESPRYHPSQQPSRSPGAGSREYKPQSYNGPNGDRPGYGPSHEDSVAAKPASYRNPQPSSMHSPPGGLPSPGLSRTSGSMASHTSSPMNSSSRGPTLPPQPPSPYKSSSGQFSLPPLQLPPLNDPHNSNPRAPNYTKTPGPPISFDSAVNQTFTT